MLIRCCLYQSHLRFNCISLKIGGISLSLGLKNMVITSWQQIHTRCLLSYPCSTHWGMYSVGKSSICCSSSLFLIMLSLKMCFGVKQVLQAIQLCFPRANLTRVFRIAARAMRPGLWGSLVCDQLPRALYSAVPDWQSSHLGWDEMSRNSNFGNSLYTKVRCGFRLWTIWWIAAGFFPDSWCLLVPFINFPLVLWQQGLYVSLQGKVALPQGNIYRKNYSSLWCGIL